MVESYSKMRQISHAGQVKDLDRWTLCTRQKPVAGAFEELEAFGPQGCHYPCIYSGMKQKHLDYFPKPLINQRNLAY